VCNYCGCRALEPIAELTAEHERILNLRGEIRRAVARDDFPAALTHLEDLRRILDLHDAVEELSLYPALARHPEYSDKVGTLFDEHDDLDETIQTAMTTAATTGPGSADWSAVIAALEVLIEHIHHEEHGMFPAAAIALEPADWEHVAAVRQQHLARLGHGDGHGHSHGHPH
jgi:iron-sulfur cluster repair protein YtfE (RIC family)